MNFLLSGFLFFGLIFCSLGLFVLAPLVSSIRARSYGFEPNDVVSSPINIDNHFAFDENLSFHWEEKKEHKQKALRHTKSNPHERLFEEFFKNGKLNVCLEENFICLIQKKDSAVLVKDFMPISLTPSVYKIVAKVLAQRLKRVMPSIISPTQSAFISGRQLLTLS